MCQRFSDGAGDVGIRNEFSECQRRDRLPHEPLKPGSFEAQRQVEASQASLEIGLHLLRCSGKQRIGGFSRAGAAPSYEGARCDASVARFDQ